MLIHNNRRTCYANSFVILYYHIKTCYANAHIIVITHTSYAISYIKVLNDLCIYTKRLYTFPQLYNATPYYIIIIKIYVDWNHKIIGLCTGVTICTKCDSVVSRYKFRSHS